MKTCKQCGSKYIPKLVGQKVCGIPCAIQYNKEHPTFSERAAKALETAQKRARIALKRQARDRLETVTTCLNRAQAVFNKWIREVRDRDQPCISCGRTDATKWDAGHWRSRKAASHLRFHPDNVWKQCARPCNQDLSGNVILMEQGMIARIGKERVDAIRYDNRVKKWTKEEAREIEAHYKGLIKEFERGNI